MIKIITDSTCDITQEEAKLLNIEIIPLTILFGDTEYQDGIDLSHEEFYQKLSDCTKLPITSQIPPAVFEDIFSKYQNPDDSILGIFLSSDLSGTFQSAHLATMNLEQNNIHLVDSRNVSIGTALLIREAVKLRDIGMSVEDIVQNCTLMAKRIRTVAVVDTLKYLKMGGRLSASDAMLGQLLHINPIIAVVDGKIKVIAKARGIKSATKYLEKMLAETPAAPDTGIVFGHANATPSMEHLQTLTSDQTQYLSLFTGSIGSAVGTHLGPGAFGYSYLPAATASTSNTPTEFTYCA